MNYIKQQDNNDKIFKLFKLKIANTKNLILYVKHLFQSQR